MDVAGGPFELLSAFAISYTPKHATMQRSTACASINHELQSRGSQHQARCRVRPIVITHIMHKVSGVRRTRQQPRRLGHSPMFMRRTALAAQPAGGPRPAATEKQRKWQGGWRTGRPSTHGGGSPILEFDLPGTQCGRGNLRSQEVKWQRRTPACRREA